MDIPAAPPPDPNPASVVLDWIDAVAWAVLRAAELLLSLLTEPLLGWFASQGMKVDPSTLYVLLVALFVLLLVAFGKRFLVVVVLSVLATAAWQAVGGY